MKASVCEKCRFYRRDCDRQICLLMDASFRERMGK